GSILSNMSRGASAKKIILTNQELKISKIVASDLKRKKIYFAGIDFIKGKLIGDINVTSPTGLKTYYDLTGINLAEYFFDNI
ncbi:glutathione synthase, partial [Pelagibacteraceae bacterium]|nr:glutathione synthase [Pelagibacteraceae bacterium]